MATLVTAALVAAGAVMLIDSTGDRLHRQILSEYADKMRDGLTRDDQGRWQLAAQAASGLRAGGSSMAFWIVDGDRRVRLNGLRFGPPLTVPRKNGAAYFTRVRGSKLYSGVSLPVRGKPEAWIVIVQDLDHPDVIFDDLRTQIAVVGGGLLALFIAALLAADSWIVRRSLAPIDRASREVQGISPHRLSQRVETAGLPKEVQPLLGAFNLALNRIEDAYRIERDFAADAAHELRTPLAILRLKIQQQTADPVLLRQIDALEAIVERLLLIAEVDATTCDPDETVDLRDVAESRVAEIAPLLMAGGRSVEVTGAGQVSAYAVRHIAERALDALLENTMKHTPPGTHVEVRVCPQAEIVVTDDGPGLPEGDGAHMFARFATARRAIGRSGGLGLAIAQELMHRTGGEMEAGASRRGGALLRLRFRAVPGRSA